MLENVPSKALFIRLSEGTVAPFTGAWIETKELESYIHTNFVAPFTGAWIETQSYTAHRSFRQ